MKNYLEIMMTNAKRRSAMRRLASFDDHLLRDIGLTRADVTLMMSGHRTAHTPARLDHE